MIVSLVGIFETFLWNKGAIFKKKWLQELGWLDGKCKLFPDISKFRMSIY